uniref:Uncharacterized protein n=1 Tax=Vespula pensylvanica TaxID=30213 RepID=A0A834KRA8_VESPE|nr:hypothetical protein H0235_013692 [Vespula pensylvanica]
MEEVLQVFGQFAVGLENLDIDSASVARSNLLNRVSTCDLFLQRNEKDPFLKRLITGNEIWILYENITHKRS